MITNVSIVSVFCLDVDATRDFYVDKLGFEVHADLVLEGYRWTTIGHPSQPELDVHLHVPGPPMNDESVEFVKRELSTGSFGGIGLRVDDCRKTHEELVAKGVTFLQPPAERPYGVEALLRDNSGNWVVLVEPKPFTPPASA
jgi:catechol 2,3-dioxygenase-like lactoylglutathione lyase family enzyme